MAQPYVNAGTSAATIAKNRRTQPKPFLPDHGVVRTPPKPKPYVYPAGGSDPFAPMSAGDITSAINHFAGMYGSPLGDSQIQSMAQTQIDPLIAAITKNVNARAAASSSAIRDLTGSYARDLAGIDYTAPYQQAAGQQAAVDASLQQSLSGAGSDLASQLKSRLAAFGDDPAVQQTAGGLAATGQAAGNTELAHGSSALSALLANSAAAGSYGLKQPGIAKLAGLQGVSQAQSNAVNDISDQTSQVLGQLPAIVQALRQSNQTLRGDRAGAAANLYATLTGQNVTKATAKAGLQNQNFDNTLAYANTFGVDPSTGQPVKGYHVDGKGNVVKDVTPKPPKPRSATATKQLNDLAHTLYNGVAPHYHPVNIKDPKTGAVTVDWEPVPGTGAKPTKWNAAVRQLISAGAKDRAEAVAILVAQGWKPGEGGRPRTAQQKATDSAAQSAAKTSRERDARSSGRKGGNDFTTGVTGGGGNF